MNTIFLALSLLFLPTQPQEEAPDAKIVETTLDELAAALKQKEMPAKLNAIERASRVVDSKIIKAISRTLKLKDYELQRAGIEALRRMRHPDALKQLESAVARNKDMRKNPETFAALLRGIGQHANPKSIELLKRDIFAVKDRGAVNARLMALANIRHKDSVEALMGIMKSGARNKVAPYMDDFCLALMVLTGKDQGKSQEQWLSWWNDNKKTLVVSDRQGLLPEAMQRRWDSFWGNPRKYERSKKRGKRGQDPENDSQ
ncbi:MAG: HEAT repeat protein [Planctomycetota bacterium]|jgi:HEAT repeat protein